MDPRFLNELRQIVGEAGLITRADQLRTYECDGLTNFRVMPGAVVIPSAREQVQPIVQACNRHKVAFVARGSGTGLSGGALPVDGGIVISLARLTRILEVDLPNQRVVVEPGVINASVTLQVAPHGYFYAPDPSSQSVCSIGGNIAENSGGAHCLKYGFTTTQGAAAPRGSITSSSRRLRTNSASARPELLHILARMRWSPPIPAVCFRSRRNYAGSGDAGISSGRIAGCFDLQQKGDLDFSG